MFLAATWQHIVITTGGFHQISVEVLGLVCVFSCNMAAHCYHYWRLSPDVCRSTRTSVVFLAAIWQHIVITTGGFHQMSV